jgi:putative heme degradation protein
MLSHIQQLLTDLARTPALVCTVGRDGAVSELFLDGSPQKVEFADSWATVEFAAWHIHVDLSTVVQVRFAEAPGHDDSVSAFIAFDDSAGKSVLRFYFPHPSHTYKTYTTEELGLFGKFQEKYGEGLGVRG